MRPIRNSDPSIYRLISIRTCSAQFLIPPSRKVQRLIGGILARYQEIFAIELYAYFFLSNHFHLLIRAPRGNTDEFCENLNREIAHRINRKIGREGKFWSRRYDDIEVGNAENDLLEAFLYVSTNATRHGLLKNSADWPGLNSFHHAINERDREFSFYHYSAEREEDKVTKHKIKLSVLPQFADISPEQRRLIIGKVLQEKLDEYYLQRREAGQGFLGLEKILTLGIGDIPLKSSKSKRPWCFTKCIATLIKRRKEIKQRMEAYCSASFDYRRGKLDAVFPHFSFKPPTHRLPRLMPFQPLSPFKAA